MNMTENQLEAVNCTSNCVVTAGAGSGKTMVLAQRFLRLVEQGLAHCDEILTVTFTKKATAEMKGRIHALLVEKGLTEELKRFPDAGISTVDSFCAGVVRADSRHYGISPTFSAADESDLRKQAEMEAASLLKECLESPRSPHGKTVETLLKYAEPEQITELFTELALNSFSMVRPLEPEKCAQAYMKYAQSLADGYADSFTVACTSYIDRFSGHKSLGPNAEMLEAVMARVSSGELSAAGEVVFNRGLGSGEEKEKAKQLKTRILESAASLKVCLGAVENEEFVRGFYALAADFEKRIMTLKRSSGALSFSDIMQLAIDILIWNKSLRETFKRRYKFVMIDEFQDNNDDYRKLLYLLSEKTDLVSYWVPEPQNLEPGKIFLVGDEKQSIYRFRGADVSVFKRIGGEIMLSGGRMLELDTNFRSEPALINTLNFVFEKVMKNGGVSFEADFRPLKTRASSGVTPRIIFHNFLHGSSADTGETRTAGQKLASAAQSEAYYLARLIKRMVSTDDFLIPDGSGGKRRPLYSDISILMRTSGSQDCYEKALMLEKIPYTTAETRALTREALVNDFYSVLNLCVFPYDAISRQAVENGPLFRVLEVDSSGSFGMDTVVSVLCSGGITAALEHIWTVLGYRNFIISNPSNQVYAEHYMWLYALGADFERRGKDITEFLSYLRPLLGESKKFRDLTVLQEQTGGVSILTIHKSKGLQFPVVIIAGMQAEAKKSVINFNAAVSGHADGNFLYLPCTPDGDKLVNLWSFAHNDLERKMEEAELKRLFYVAATRAECHLVLSACPSERQLNIENGSGRSMAAMLLSAVPFDFEKQTFLSPPPEDGVPIEPLEFGFIPLEKTFSTGRLDAGRLELCSKWYENVRPDGFDYETNRIGVTALVSDNRESAGGVSEPLPELESDSMIREHGIQTEFGTFVHRLIENRIKGISAVENPLFTGLSPAQGAVLVKDAEKLTEAFINSGIYRRLLSEGFTLYPERRFSVYSAETGMLTDGVIDLLAVGKKEAAILDYKTDSFRNEAEHRAQLGIYLDAVRAAYPEKNVRAFVVYLRDPASVLEILPA